MQAVGGAPKAITLFLWTQEARSGSEEGVDPWDCTQCRRRGFYKDRAFCVDSRRQAEWVVPFNDPLCPFPAVRMTAKQVLAFLPSTEPFEFLLSRRTLDGRQICPVRLYNDANVYQAIELEADMEKWHLPPYPGTSGDWPVIAYDAVRQVRMVRGLIQAKHWKNKPKEPKNEQEGDVRARR